MEGGKFKRKLSEVNVRAVSRGQNELVCKFKMAAGDMVSIRGQVMEYIFELWHELLPHSFYLPDKIL